MADARLASEIGTHIARMIHSHLDEIGEACWRDAGQVTFSTTVTFKRDKDGGISAKIEPRKRIPLDPVEIKLSMRAGKQLMLFGGEPTDT